MIVSASVLGAIALLMIGNLVAMFFLFGKGDKTVDSLEEYIALCKSDEYYPTIPEDITKNCNQIDFRYEQHLWALSSERWYRIVMTYDDRSFTEQQEHFNQSCDFAFDAAENQTGGYSPDFIYGGFTFKTAVPNIYPKSMLFIGFNEKEKQICYLYFEDYELDSTDDFPQFFRQHKFIPE